MSETITGSIKQQPESETAALVVTYNRKDLLKECLQALENQSEKCSIIVVDNASDDGTDAFLEPLARAGKIVYIRMDQNLGGAGGFARALKAGAKSGAKYLWAMDDDCIPEPDALEQLLKFEKEHPEAGFLSSKVVWTDGSLCRMNEPKLLKGHPEDDRPCKARQASFVSFFTTSEMVRKHGLPIAEFFIWGDDVEYTRRISAKEPCWYVPASRVVHKTASNTGSDISRDGKERLPRYRYAYRNEVYIAREEGFSRRLYQIAKILLHTGRVIAHAPGQKAERIGIIWSASKEGLHFNPQKEEVDG